MNVSVGTKILMNEKCDGCLALKEARNCLSNVLPQASYDSNDSVIFMRKKISNGWFPFGLILKFNTKSQARRTSAHQENE